MQTSSDLNTPVQTYLAAPSIAQTQGLPEVRWRCASSFPKSLDTIYGGGGADTISGGLGDDFYVLGKGKDTVVDTGGQVISDDLGMKLESVTVDMLGRAKKVIIDKDNTTIIDGAGEQKDIEGRVKEIRGAIEKSTSDYDREKLQERLAKLSGGVAVIKVGAATEVELKEKKHRIEDAVSSVRAAIEDAAGGGLLDATRSELRAAWSETSYRMQALRDNDSTHFEQLIDRPGLKRLPLTIITGNSHHAIAACDAALVASGTATLEVALFKKPMVISYRMNPASWQILRLMAYQPWVGLPNVLAGAFVVPEFLQEQATAANLAQAALNLFDDTVTRRRDRPYAWSSSMALSAGINAL